jgi:LPXTG-motif cell wall-anchored protein
MRRAFTVVATAVVAVAGFAGPASAATDLPPCTPGDGYIPGRTCEAVIVVDTECVNGAPVLDYSVPAAAVNGASTVDVRWTNLPGADVVRADQPLSVDNQAWPAGADASVTLVFATTPADTRVNVTAPTDCSEGLVSAAPSRSGTRAQSGVLAATGSDALPLALGGGALILGGAALVLARRSRQTGA